MARLVDDSLLLSIPSGALQITLEVDPFFENSLNLGSNDERPGSAIQNFGQILHQMAALRNIRSSRLAPPASKRAVKKLKKVQYEGDTETQCSICLRVIEAGETGVTMPCQHEFHDECILAWLNKTNSCPVCRHELKTDDVAYEELRKSKKREARREARRKQNLQNLHNSMYS